MRIKGLVGQGGAKIEIREVASIAFLTMKIFGENRGIEPLTQEGPKTASSAVIPRPKVLNPFQRTTAGNCIGFPVRRNIVRPWVGDYSTSKTAWLSDAMIGAVVGGDTI